MSELIDNYKPVPVTPAGYSVSKECQGYLDQWRVFELSPRERATLTNLIQESPAEADLTGVEKHLIEALRRLAVNIEGAQKLRRNNPGWIKPRDG